MAVKKIWQDQNACDFQDQHSQNIYDMIQTLKKNYSIFIKTLEDIANSYAKAGGMHEKFSPMLNESMIFNASLSYTEIGAHKFHPYFTEGYGMMETFTDEFGFINPETGGQEVLDVFNELVTFLEKRTDEIVNEIKGINAFGNITVKLNLAKSAGLVVTELSDALSKSSKQIQELLALIETNEVASNRLKNLVNNHLESKYDFESLMKYLKKLEKTSIMNI